MGARKPTFVSLFAGCGGFDLGFTQAGFRCISAFEVDPAAVQTYRKNVAKTVHEHDLTQSLPRPAECRNIDVLLAGPPCQGFSTAGKRNINDPRNKLLLVPAVVAEQLNPKIIVVENVMGSTSGSHRKYWERLRFRLRHLGYRTADVKCNARDLGVPQERRRALLIAWRTAQDVPISIPMTPGGVLSDALANLIGLPNHDPRVIPIGSKDKIIAGHIRPGQKLCNVRASPRAVHTWDIPTIFGRISATERKVLEAILRLRRRNRKRDFGDADPVAMSEVSKTVGFRVQETFKSLKSKGYLRRRGNGYDVTHTFNGKYRRLPLGEPCPTVDTRFGNPRFFLHPVEDRGFSVREAARVQGFPDNFVFDGSLATQYRLIGNAVPPPMAKQIAHFLHKAFFQG